MAKHPAIRYVSIPWHGSLSARDDAVADRRALGQESHWLRSAANALPALLYNRLLSSGLRPNTSEKTSRTRCRITWRFAKDMFAAQHIAA